MELECFPEPNSLVLVFAAAPPSLDVVGVTMSIGIGERNCLGISCLIDNEAEAPMHSSPGSS